MGVGHLDIGISQGGAQVFGHNPAIQMYANLLAKQQAKKDADNKYLAEQLASVKPDGLRNDADRQNFYKKYADVRQQAIDAENIKDPMQKAMAIANVRQGMMGLSTYVDESKKQGAKENSFAQTYMANPSNWSQDAIDKHRASTQAAIGDPNLVSDYTTLQRRVDPDKVDKLYQAHKDLITKNMQYDNGTQTPATIAGKKGMYVVQTRGLPMDGTGNALENTMHWATSQPDVQKSLQDRYPQIKGASDQETLGLRVKQYMNDMGDKDGIYDQTKPTFHPYDNSLEKHIKERQYDINNPLPNQIQANQLTPVQQYAAGMMNGNEKMGKDFAGLIPSNKFKPGEKADFKIVNGQHILTVPEQVEPDQKAMTALTNLKAAYQKNPEKKGDVLGFGGTSVPFEQSAALKKFNVKNSLYKHKADAQTYELPNDPIGYTAKVAEIAAKNGMPITAINSVAGGKGGHGLNQAIQEKVNHQQSVNGTPTSHKKSVISNASSWMNQ